MSLEKEIIIKFEEIEKRIHSLNKRTSANTAAINSVVSELESEIKNTEVFNFTDKIRMNRKKGFNYIYVDRLCFLCKTTSLTKINLTVNTHLYSTGANYTATLYVMLNTTEMNNPIYTTTVSYNSHLDHTFTFEYEFHPTQENNFIRIRLDAGNTNSNNGNIEVVSAHMTVTGTNIVFLNRSNEFKVYISKDYYYLTKNNPEGGYYLKALSNNVDLSSTFASVPNVIPPATSGYDGKYFPFDYTYIPKILYNSTTGKYETDNSVDFFVFCINYNNYIVSGIANPPSGTLSLVGWCNRGFVYSIGHPGNNDLNPRNACFANSANPVTSQPCMTNSESFMSSTFALTLNGEKVTGIWVSNVPVFAKEWEDNPGNPYMCVATDDLGFNYFFPTKHTTYTVPLGKGYQTNAYLQPDGSINVYMRWIDKVYKKVLIFNSEKSQYELTDSVTVFNNTWEILEGYSADYFINNKGKWSYVPAT